jgi:hypothetical protein
MTVYRGISQHGRKLAPLYESMIGEVIILPGFTSTSTGLRRARIVARDGWLTVGC